MRTFLKTVGIRSHIYLKIALVAALAGLFRPAAAQTAFDDFKAGGAINSCTLTVYDPARITAPPAGHVYRNDNPVIDVLLELRDNKNNYYPNNWKLELYYEIDLYTTATSFTTQYVQMLNISYDKNKPFKDIHIKSYKGYVKAVLRFSAAVFTLYPNGGGTTVTSVVPANTSLIDWTDIVFTLRYTPDYTYSKASTNTALVPKHANYSSKDFCVGTTPLDTANEMPVSWPVQLEAQSYDFEWVFVDIPDGNLNADVTIDWRNAMRVNVPNPSFNIPLAYPRGKIVYRVRTISREWDATNSVYYRNEGAWSQSNAAYTQLITSAGVHYFNYCGMEPGKNWAYSASYAEEGKRGEQLSFLDATGRSRRSIGYNYQDNKAIVSKTYYDKQGRAAVQALPVPVKNTGNGFYAGYNDSFDQTTFDTQTALANSPGMGTSDPATVYYSASNPFLSTTPSLAYVPDAEKYPFVQTKFKNDGSGRADAVSAPGPNLKIGSGHETRFYYGAVEGQQLLDRLFGNEVGFSQHYHRNMAVDPNGVSSVSYIDGSGRVIASALAGSASMQNLENLTHSSSNITVNLLDNMVIGTDGSVSNLKEIIVPVTGLYTFSYSLQGISHDLGCFGSRACRYDVVFTVTNEAGEYQNITYNGNALPTLTLANITDQASAITFTANLTPGKYSIQKLISLSSATEAYVDELEAYVRNSGMGPENVCIPQDLPQTECLTCSQKCERVYKYDMTYNGITGTVWIGEAVDGVNPLYTNSTDLKNAFPDDFTLDQTGLFTDPIETLISQCQALCENPAPQVNLSECDIMRQVLLMDVSPGGQYFDNHPATFIGGDTTQAAKDQWLNMFVPVAVKTALFTTAGVSSWKALRGAWTDAMALQLLPYHPEFCQYDYFCNQVANMGERCCKPGGDPDNVHANSGAYDHAMHLQHTDAYGEDGDNTFFDPLDLNHNLITPPVPSQYIGICQNRDPYFCDNPTGYDQMADYLVHYIENPWTSTPMATTYFSIWDVLGDDGSSYTASTPEQAALITFLQTIHHQFDVDTISRYQFFRGYYQGRKKQIIQNAFPAWSATHCNTCNNFVAQGCSTCVSINPSTPQECRQCWLSAYDDQHDGVVDPSHTAPACAGATTTSGSLSLENFDIRYPYIMALNGEESSPEDLCTIHCSGYANHWIAQLADAWMGCEIDGGLTQEMRDYLYDGFYNYCMPLCTPGVTSGTLPDFNGSTAQHDLDAIIDNFKTAFGVDICPSVHVPAADAPDKLSCQCGNLAEMIVAAGAVGTTYPNPLHFGLYDKSVDDVVNLSVAADYISAFLTELNDLPVTVSSDDLKGWLLTCGEGTASSIPGLPQELQCGVSGMGTLSCEDFNAPIDHIMALAQFEDALAQLLTQYRSDLLGRCTQNLYQRETFTVSYALNEFQYTLYYYDRAGNLVKTVPPEGVDVMIDLDVAAAGTYRNANYTSPTYSHTAPGTPNINFKRPDHRLVTNYKYNSLEQLMEQTTPDAGTTRFWYDAVGRLVLSQNAKQYVAGGDGSRRYSYTKYDPFGRIFETGEVTYSGTFTHTNVADPTWLTGFYSTADPTRTQVTYTLYDVAQTGTNLPAQANLRNRVASSYYFEAAPVTALTNYVHATHYSYDVHGNVTKSIQDFPFLNQFGMRFSETAYEYELVSGNVKKVSYRKDKKDQFYHRYQYDKSSRLVTVQTSRNGKIWETDAQYYYQPHGPVYRVETGDKLVQGTDYAQTIQGWHKAVNAQRLDPTVDMGTDGRHVLATADKNHLVARDAFGYSLTYFNGDYKRIGTSRPAFEADLFAGPMGTSIMGQGTTQDPRGQYNGNIAATVTALRDATETPTEELGQVFRYDQLYRLSSSRSFVRANSASFTWVGVNATNNRWATNYTYDANGNIKTLQRYNEASTATLIDNLAYGYDISSTRLNSNRLYNVNDPASSSSTVQDYRVNNLGFNAASAVSTGHFRYDEIGNLVKDKGEGGELNIEWNLYGKVKKVTRTSGTKADLEFYYDAAGRRVMKIAKPHGGTQAQWLYTIFAYDAGGQLMAEYDIEYISASGTYNLNHQGHYVYGASRLGRTRRKVPVKKGIPASYVQVQACTTCAGAALVADESPATPPDTVERHLGYKQYEFSNHLGNVLATTSDRRLAVDDGTYIYSAGTLTKTSSVSDGKLDYYLPDVLTSNDYYPGGMPMPGRTFEGSSCTTVSSATTTTVHSADFAAGASGYVAIPTSTATVTASGGMLTVDKVSSFKGIWGTRTPSLTLTAGTDYSLSYAFSLGSCAAGTSTNGWRVVDASTGTVIVTNTVGTGTITGTFTVPANGSYYIEFFRTTQNTGTCQFKLDNVSLTYTAYTNTTTCGTPGTGDIYPWGHNGQFKDNELYGNDMAYTSEYWEYDSRLLRRWNTDPIEYEWQSPYACFNNNPIYYADPAGLEGTNETGGGDKRKRGRATHEDVADRKEADGTSYSEDGSTRQNGNSTQHYEPKCDCYLGDYSGTPAPSQPQDGADESPTGTILGDIIVESTPHYRIYDGIKKGDVGKIFFASNPAAEIVYDGWTAPGKIVYYTAQGDYLKAGGVYVNHVVTGASIMVGMRTPALAVDGEALTEAAKRTFVQEVEATSNELVCAVDDIGCFAAGTQVMTESGLVNIEDIKEGDKVYAYDVDKKEWVLGTVEKISIRRVRTILKIYHGDGVIITTAEHPFFIDGQWKRAGNLAVGDLFLARTGKKLFVDSIISVDSLINVYNFEVKGLHSYCIAKEGIVVHNGPCPGRGEFNVTSFADEIIEFNKTTDGGGILLNGTPSSAISSAMYYETAAEQGASIFRSISGGHMFMNGNKRTAVAVFQSFAKQHGLTTVSQKQMMNIATQVATGEITDISQIAKMLIK